MTIHSKFETAVVKYMWSAEYRAASIQNSDVETLSHLYRVNTSILLKKNIQVIEWSLIANMDLEKGTFLGFYTGEFTTEQKSSIYSAQVDDILIYPFENEQNITEEERNLRPFANMNEPKVNRFANCCMIPQDFLHNEVSNVPAHEMHAHFFRGLACFTCDNITKGEELTWYYGKSYESHRQHQGYMAGKACKAIIEKEIFIPSNSQGVLQILSKVSRDCVFPVFKLRKTERISTKKRQRKQESDDSESSSSGSGHIPKYVPKQESRDVRRERRNLRKSSN